MRIRESAQAIEDSEHIAKQMFSAKAGVVFLDELQKTYGNIALTPTIGSSIDDLAGSQHEGLMQCTVRRFRNYVIFYRIDREEIVIERVLDGRRDYLELFE